MYTVAGEYNIFILENQSITRFEIGDSYSRWHDINSNILYGEYKRQSLRAFGDYNLARLYKNTIKNAKNLACEEKVTEIWADGFYVKETLKFISDDEYYGYTEKSGVFQCELCKYGGVLIEVYVYEEECSLDLPPLNRQEYKRVNAVYDTPIQRTDSDNYENFLYLSAYFKNMFFVYVKQEIDIDSDGELISLFYAKRKLPILIKSRNGKGSVKPKAIAALAGIMRETPSKAFTKDIKDKNGKLVLRANVINNAEYPEAVFLSKYRYYAGRTAKMKNI
jgi:hypothetical protein